MVRALVTAVGQLRRELDDVPEGTEVVLVVRRLPRRRWFVKVELMNGRRVRRAGVVGPLGK